MRIGRFSAVTFQVRGSSFVLSYLLISPNSFLDKTLHIYQTLYSPPGANVNSIKRPIEVNFLPFVKRLK